MLNYVPKEKALSPYECTRQDDPKMHRDFKRMRIRELKYNKYQIKEVDSLNHSTSLKANGSVQNHTAGHIPPPDPSPDMSPLHLHQNLETDVREIKRYIKTLLYKQKHAENLDKMRGEWRAIALVLDRLFFVLYVLSIIVSLATMFPKSK